MHQGQHHVVTQKPERFTRYVLAVFAALIAPLVVGMALKLRPADGTRLLVFQPNWLVAITVILLIVYFAMFVLLNRPANRSRTTLWFSLYSVAGMLSLAAGAMASMNPYPEGFRFWYILDISMLMSLGPLLLLFVLAYTKHEANIYSTSLLTLLAAAAITSILALWQVPAIPTAHYAPWGYQALLFTGSRPDASLSSFLMGFQIMYACIATSAILLIRYQRRLLRGSVARRQASIILTGILMPAAAALTSIAVAQSGATQVFVTLGAVLQAVLVTYAMLRHRLFTGSQTIFSEKILETMQESVITTTTNLVIGQLNAAAEKLFATQNIHQQGVDLWKLVGSANADIIQKHIGSSETDAIELALDIGTSSLPVSLLASPVMDAGQLTGYVLVFRDITKERAAQAEIERQVRVRTEELHTEQAKLASSIESLEVGFVMIGTHDKVILHNGALSTIFGVSPHEWTLPLLAEHLGKSGQAYDLQGRCDKIRTHNAAPINERVTTTSGKIVQLFMAPVRYRETVVGIVVLIRDITEEEVLARSRDEFFSIASHELRTPLTAIRGNASMIMQMYEDAMKDKGLHEMVYDIHESSTRLIDIVNDFLDVSRLEQGKTNFEYTEVAIDKVIENVVYEMRAVLNEKHISLTTEETLNKLPHVWADQNRLKQVMYNLVGNAVKFTDKGGVTIDAKAEGDIIKVTVADTGRGISKEGQNLLFHKFQQAGDSLLTRDTSRGTGLGLYISKILVETMGGKIALDSTAESKGSTFSITIPVAGSRAHHSANHKATVDAQTGLAQDPIEAAANLLSKNPSTTTVTPAKSKLLIVEDDPYVLRLYERMFTSTPIELKTANNGGDGLKLARSWHPDIILLDVMMPVMNGLEVLTRLKSDTTTQDIPVFMLSNLGEETTVKEALQKGANAYLIKSNYTPEQILDKVTQKLHGQPAK